MRGHARILWVIVFTAIMLGVFVYANAQQPHATCPALIEQALTSMGNNCSSLDRNSACYGYRDVNATFSQATAPEFFSQPSDRAELITLQNIGTSPMDTAAETWGIALMSVQANLPDTLPGQNAVFMLLGNTQVENAVQPDNAATAGAATPLEVTTSMAAGLFYRAVTSDTIVSAIPAQAALSADAITAGGDWVRVVFDGKPGWVTRAVLTPDDAIDALPVVNPDAQTPMQAFYLRTGITGTECSQAPDSLVVQGPQDLQIDLTVNGADMRLGSTVALRLIPLSDDLAARFAPYYSDISKVSALMELDVIDGHAVLNPNTPDEVTVPEGFWTVRCLSDPENLGLDGVNNDRQVLDGCPWLPPEQWRPSDYSSYQALQGVSLNYPIHMPLPPTPTYTPSPRPVILPTHTPTPEDEFTPTYTPTVSDTPEITDTVTATITDTPTYTDTAMMTDTLTYTPTDTPAPTDTATDTPAPTDTPSNTPTDTPLPTSTPSPTDTPFIIP